MKDNRIAPLILVITLLSFYVIEGNWPGFNEAGNATLFMHCSLHTNYLRIRGDVYLISFLENCHLDPSNILNLFIIKDEHATDISSNFQLGKSSVITARLFETERFRRYLELNWNRRHYRLKNFLLHSEKVN